jgi:hypothetical protein
MDEEEEEEEEDEVVAVVVEFMPLLLVFRNAISDIVSVGASAPGDFTVYHVPSLFMPLTLHSGMVQ